MRSVAIRFGVAIATELILLAALKFFDDWTLESMPVKFVGCAVVAGVAYFAAASQFPVRLTKRQQAMTLWAGAVLLRLAVLPLEPGDDLWRYQWEGKVQRAGFNPYAVAPDDPRLESLRETFPNWQRINHRDWSAIYPPGAELIFRGLSGLSDNPLLYKLAFAAADLATLALVIRLIGGANRFAVAAWYAFNPLVVYSFAGAAHFDSLMILPMTAAVLFLARHGETDDARSKWLFAFATAIAFGLAISIKLVPALLLLLAAFALRLQAAALVTSVALPVSVSAIYGWPKIDIWHSLGQFARVTRLNDLFWWLIEATVWANPRQKNLHYNIVTLSVVAIVSFVFARNWRRGMLWALGSALILSPVLHPWYCAWIIPLATWRAARPWHVLSVALFAYYLFWDERLFTLPWHAEPWQRAMVILPPIIALLLAWRRRAATSP